jgi:hypothetical protein
MEISIVDKSLIISDTNQSWNLDQSNLIDPPTKSPQGYILFCFVSTKSNKGTWEIRIYPNDVTLPVHNGLDDLFVVVSSWWNLAQRRRAFDDVTEQFDNIGQIIATYPVGVTDLKVGNMQTGSLWLWFVDHWMDTHIPNKLGGIYNRTPIPFVNQQVPTITSYQEVYAAQYTQNPTVTCWAYNSDGKYAQRQEMPQTTMVDGKIDTLYFELSEATSGNIILQ